MYLDVSKSSPAVSYYSNTPKYTPDVTTSKKKLEPHPIHGSVLNNPGTLNNRGSLAGLYFHLLSLYYNECS